MADQAQLLEEQEREASLARERARIAAQRKCPLLKRHNGICIDCDEPIGRARLSAEPDADRCHYCQDQFERAQ